MKNEIEIYGDDIGKVQYIDHMGSDLTVVNSFGLSTIAIEHGLITRFLVDTRTKTFSFMSQECFEANTRATDKQAMQTIPVTQCYKGMTLPVHTLFQYWLQK